MQDKRLTNRLENYWNLIRRGMLMPEIQRLNPGSLDDMWQQCMQMHVVREPDGVSYSYRFMGEKLVQMYGENLTGQTVNTRMARYPLSVVVGKLDEVMASKKFLMDENQFVSNHGKLVKYRACFMPFGNEEKGVTHIVIGFSGREF